MNPLMNPLLIKELREEMRSKKIFLVVPIYIALLSIVSLIAVSSNTGTSFNPAGLAGSAGITLYSYVITISILLALVSIVLGASSVTVEKEKATYELLELTPLSYTQLLIGKFLHIVIFIGMILLSSLPVLSTLFFMGGLTYTDLFLSLGYLLVFVAVVILGAICISIALPRTNPSIILSLALGFILVLTISIFSATVFNQPKYLGFAVFSPWLVTGHQIFSPTPLKLAGHDFPVWPFYLMFYLAVGSLFITWGHNSLDSRKLERNPWARIIGLILIQLYVAVGLLCMKSYSPLTTAQLDDLIEAGMVLLLVILPCFAMGVVTEKDQLRFQQHPIRETFHPVRVWLNSPITGMFYLILLIFTLLITVYLCSGAPFKTILFSAGALFVWVFPWLLIFSALRLFGLKQRGILQVYLLVTVFYVILSAFRTGKGSIIDFLFFPSGVLLFLSFSVLFYLIARMRSKRLAVFSS